MTLDRTDEGFFDELVGIINSEPNLAARLLEAANSAQSAPRSPVTSVRAAASRLGSSGAANLVTALGVTTVFVPRDKWEQSLWRHSLQVAEGAGALAATADEPALKREAAHTAGLLHDIGRFVMFLEAPDALREIDEGNWNSPQELVELERTICGLTHTEIGSIACTQWNLPHHITETVRRHHEPRDEARDSSSVTDMIVELVHFADLALFPSAYADSPNLSEEHVANELIPKLPSFLKLSPQALLTLITEAIDRANTAASALGLGGTGAALT